MIMSHKNIIQHTTNNIKSQDPISLSGSLTTVGKNNQNEFNSSSSNKI